MEAALNLPINEVMILLDEQEREMKLAVPRRGGGNMRRLSHQLMGGMEDKATRRPSKVQKRFLTPAEMAARGWA